METAVEVEPAATATGGVATLIESCLCPSGYAGLSCQVTTVMSLLQRKSCLFNLNIYFSVCLCVCRTALTVSTVNHCQS